MKDNTPISSIDLGEEVRGNGGGKLSFFIGRSPDCHVVLNDLQVSREHAELIFENNNWKIKQSSDYSQLIVNNNIIQEKELNSGDIINIGPFVIWASFETSSLESRPSEQIEEYEDEALEDGEGATETIALTEEALEEEVDSSNNEEVESSESFEMDDNSFETDFSGPEEAHDEETSEEVSFEENEESEFPEDEDGMDHFEGSESYDIESLDDDDDVGEKTQVIQTFAKYELELFGEFAPYDKFTLENTEALIGRDPSKCQIVLNDPEVSSIHATIKRNNVLCTLEDMQSGNGTILNGERVNKAALTNGDEFIIGSTTFTVRIVSDLISQEENRLMPVEENQVIEVEEVVEVDADFEGGADDGLASFGEDDDPMPEDLVGKLKWRWKRATNIQKIIVVAVLIILLLPDFGSKKPTPKKKKAKVTEQKKTDEVKFSAEELERIDPVYQLAKKLTEAGKYSEALLSLDEVSQLTRGQEYKRTKQLREIAKTGLRKLEEIEKKRREEEERELRALKIKKLLEKATKATDERKVELAENLFSEIKSLDPENLEVSQLELDLKAWKDEQNRKRLEEAERKAERRRKEDSLKPGKEAYFQKKWYLAINRLERFLQISGMDEDLTKEASKILIDSKRNLNGIVQPLLGRARSLREGQDLKGAYENYKEILKYEPTNNEALNEMDQIQDRLKNRARKIYREAIISESLYLFDDAKEKFQEVQQISPSDSDYYKKATDKLKNYLD